tara:strand:- start:31795 stop:32742 length:948 start_codon:yes stop_codon:yes gene_type:complete
MNRLNSLCLLFTVILLTGCDELPLQALGQLESDRIELVAEVFESILSITVLEGDRLAAGRLILQQDTSRVEIRIAEARANIARIEALLAEQVSGPRTETIDTVKASLDEAEIDRVFRQRDLNRLLELREQNLTSIESVDTAEKYVELARARIEIVQAQLAELEAGTRQEQIAQTNGLLEQARAQLASLELDRQRHSITAPVDSLLDSLPFEIGERPRPGDVIAVLLSGDQPYARLYIPESVRIQIRPGSTLQVHVDGIDGPLTGTVRRISSEPSFTPYFALTERDRGRLSYVAEVALPAMPNRLPDGVPVQVNFQ